MLLSVVYFIQHKFSPVSVLCIRTQTVVVGVVWMPSFEVTVMSELALTLMRLFILLQFSKNHNYMCVPPCLTDEEHLSPEVSS